MECMIDRLFKIEGNYIKDYRTGDKLLENEGNYIKEYGRVNKLLEMEGNYIKSCHLREQIYES